MGNEECCSNKPEQSEIKVIKPEKNLLTRPSNNNFAITPQINFETERQNEPKEESDDLENELNIIQNEELVYGRIDSLQLKKEKDDKLKNSFKNKNYNNKVLKNDNFNEDKDSPQDNVKKNKTKISSNQRIIENTNVNNNKIRVPPIDLNSYKFFDNNNNDNKKKENIKKAYTPAIVKVIKTGNNKNIDYPLNDQANNYDSKINKNYNYQEPQSESIQEESFVNKDKYINNKNTEEFYNNNIDDSNSSNNNNNNTSNNIINNKSVFIKPIVNSLKNTYKKKIICEKQLCNLGDKENNNLILNANIIPNEIMENKEININLIKNNEFIPDNYLPDNEKIIQKIKAIPMKNNIIIPSNKIYQNNNIIQNNNIYTNNNIVQNNFIKNQNHLNIKEEINEQDKQKIQPFSKEIEKQNKNIQNEYRNLIEIPKYDEILNSGYNSKIISELKINNKKSFPIQNIENSKINENLNKIKINNKESNSIKKEEISNPLIDISKNNQNKINHIQKINDNNTIKSINRYFQVEKINNIQNKGNYNKINNNYQKNEMDINNYLINDNNYYIKDINNYQYSSNNNKSNNEIKEIINYTLNEDPQLYISKMETINNKNNKENFEYNSPIKTYDPIITYNSPAILYENYEDYKNNNQNINCINESKNIKQIIEFSPIKYNNPIYICDNVEKDTSLSLNPTKILPPTITNEGIITSSLQPKSKPTQRVSKSNNKNNNLDLISKAKSYDVDDIAIINKQNNNNYVNNIKSIKNNYIDCNYHTSMNFYKKNKIDNIIENNQNIYQYNNEFIQKESTDPILNQNYLTTIQNLNMNCNYNYQIDNTTLSRNKYSPKENLGNPIYSTSLEKPSKTKKNSQNNNIYYSPNNCHRSLSQDDLNSQNKRLNNINNYNNSALSPNDSSINNPNPKYNKNNNNIPNQVINLLKVSPLDIEINTKSKNIFNYYSNTDLTKLSTFSPDSFKLFYPENERYFKIPKSEINSEKEITTFINNNPNLKETYIGSVNKFGNKHGFGRLFTPTSKKIGTWRNGKFFGWGREIRNNGEIYEGKFTNWKICGKGIYKYKDILYIGDFEKNIRQGKGEKFTKNYYYNGIFNNDKIDGYGRIQFINSKNGESEYEGFFKDNNIEGKGIMKWKNGNIYEGEMKNNKMNGQGILRLNNGVVIKGLFKDGVKI